MDGRSFRVWRVPAMTWGLLLLFRPLAAFAVLGPISSGGGKAVLCGHGTHHDLVLLDVFEASIEYEPLKTQLSGQLEDDFALLLGRYWQLSGESYRGREPSGLAALQEFDALSAAARWKQSGVLLDTADASPRYPLPVGCRLVQMATQHQAEDGSFWIDIDRQLWDLASPLDRAALLLHEWIYRRERENGVVTSDRTRLLVSEVLGSLSRDERGS